MTDEAKPKGRKKPSKTEDTDSALTTAAKAIGAAAGKIAVATGIAEPAQARPQTKSTKPKKLPKLQSKNKSRLPRKQKKAMQKKAAAQS